MRDFARRGVEFDLWVRSVAEGFVQADTGAMTNSPAWTAMRGPDVPEDGGVDAAPSVAGVLPVDTASNADQSAAAPGGVAAEDPAPSISSPGSAYDDAEQVIARADPAFAGTPLDQSGEPSVLPLGVGLGTVRPPFDGHGVVDGGPGVIIDPEFVPGPGVTDEEVQWVLKPPELPPANRGEIDPQSPLITTEPEVGPGVTDQGVDWVPIRPDVLVSDDGGQEHRVRQQLQEAEGWRQPDWAVGGIKVQVLKAPPAPPPSPGLISVETVG